ncbi:MAG: ATP-dependent DNA helicase [Candidatus Thalassarchaeum sp.]|nr:ATP-dependent DNA helicase [Candidatus Thalassarchaeum sp.]
MSSTGTSEIGKFIAHDTLRDAQKEMVMDGINTLSKQGFLLAAAPTGIGKTAASLASSIEVARNNQNQILFLTGRQSQHKIVIETVRSINSNLDKEISEVKVVDLIGRESMCEDVDKMTGKCSCEDGIIESSRQSRRDDMKEYILKNPNHVDDIIKKSKKKKICAWATARSAVKECDILVCDYNHIFVENVSESSLSAMGIDLENTILIIDEAHNLPDRIRNGLERRAILRVFRDARDEIDEFLGTKERVMKKLDLSENRDNFDIRGINEALRQMKKIFKQMNIWYKKKQSDLIKSGKKDMKIPTIEFIGEIDSILNEDLDAKIDNKYTMLRKMIKQLYRVKVEQDEEEDEKETASTRLADILSISLEYLHNPALVLIFDLLGDEGRVRSFLLDPGLVSGPILASTGGAILMSGTLFPPEMYSDLLQIPENKRILMKEYESPFLGDKRPVLVAKDVTTKFTERNFHNTEKIRKHILSVVANTPGHVAFFAPSYALLQDILGDASWLPGYITIKEESNRMSKRMVNGYVDDLHRERRNKRQVLLAGVLSGKLAEGVDYPNNILDAVICLGLPLAPPSARQDALKEYYVQRFGNNKAWRYTSFQPAINSIMQALGRPIRKSEDRAIVILLEKRIMMRQFRNCLPKSIELIQSPDENRTGRLTRNFFRRHPDPAIER